MPSDPPGDLTPFPGPLVQDAPARELATLSRIRAGFPSPAADYTEDGLDLTTYLVRRPASSFFFGVVGDSMAGAGILDGDKVIVDRSLTACHRDIVVAEVADGYTLKRLILRDGRAELHPENPEFAALVPGEGEELRVWGVVTGLVRRYPPQA
jgi:DNA polymerase V